MQRMREAERSVIYDEFINMEGDILTGVIHRIENRNVFLDIGKTEAVLTPNEQIPGEIYRHGDRLKVYMVEIRRTNRGPQVVVSRTHPGLLKRLFEQEVPEIYDGTVEIMSIAREAGSRSKIAVYSKNENVDCLGACVGAKGMRVQAIVDELRGEKIDIVKWSDDPATFIDNALSPAKVLCVDVNAEAKFARVVVPNYQLSLAIGKEGQNARLAVKLTGWKIDIKSAAEMNMDEHGNPLNEEYDDDIDEYNDDIDFAEETADDLVIGEEDDASEDIEDAMIDDEIIDETADSVIDADGEDA